MKRTKRAGRRKSAVDGKPAAGPEKEKEKKKASLQELISGRYGSKVYLRPASEVKTCFDLRRPTGLVSLDVCINGGFCAGGTNILYGPAGIGKDLVADLCMAQVQKNYGDDSRILIASFGYPHDMRFASSLGVAVPWSEHDIKKLEDSIGHRLPDEARSALTRTIGRIDTLVLGEESLDSPAEVLAGAVIEAVRARSYQLIVLNEVGAQLTADGASKTIGDSPKVGDVSRFFDAFFKWYFAIMNQTSHDSPNETTLLLISQVRTRIGSGFTWLDFVGGNPMKHAAVTVLELSHGKTLTTSDGVPYGKEILCTVKKSKHGGREGDRTTFTYDFSFGIDYARDLFDAASMFGVLVRDGDSPYYDLCGKRFKGVTKVIEALSDDEFYATVRSAVFSAAGITNIRYR